MLGELARRIERAPTQPTGQVIEVHAPLCAPRHSRSTTAPRTPARRGRNLTVTEPRATRPAPRHDNSPRPDKQRPASLQAERALLGIALLAAPGRDILATVPVAAYSFDSHGHIAAAITALHLDGKAVTTVTVADRLGPQLLDRIGGGALLVELHNNAPGGTSAAPTYAETILGNWRRWRAVQIADEISYAALTHGDIAPQLAVLNDLQAHAGVDELDLDDMLAALEDTFEENPTMLTRSDGQHLLYEGAVNVLQSEPVVGKSMVAMIACAEVILDDGDALYLDYEDTPRRVARRMVNTLGLTTDQLARFHYKRLYTLSPQAVAGLPRLARTTNARIIVIDGLAEALSSLGYDENAGTDVAAWWNTIARPLADTGACVLILDHVTKSRENRGRWARGSGHKLAAVDGVAYSLDTVTSFSRHKNGKLKLVIAKDRPGIIGATGDTAALIDLTHLEHGERLAWTTNPHVGDDEWRGPTDCMALVRKLFADHPDLELARSAIAGQLKTIYDKGYRDRTVREAADRLALDGILDTFKRGKGTFFRLSPDAPDGTKQHEEAELWEAF